MLSAMHCVLLCSVPLMLAILSTHAATCIHTHHTHITHTSRTCMHTQAVKSQDGIISWGDQQLSKFDDMFDVNNVWDLFSLPGENASTTRAALQQAIKKGDHDFIKQRRWSNGRCRFGWCEQNEPLFLCVCLCVCVCVCVCSVFWLSEHASVREG